MGFGGCSETHSDKVLTPEEISTYHLSCSNSPCVCSPPGSAAGLEVLHVELSYGSTLQLPWARWDPPVPGDTHTSELSLQTA